MPNPNITAHKDLRGDDLHPPKAHTHPSGDITDFAGAVSDQVTAVVSSAVSANEDVAANSAARHTHDNKDVLDETTAAFTSDQESKLEGVADNATANDTDANLKNRANHTGEQSVSTITGLQTLLDKKQPDMVVTVGPSGSGAHYETDGTADDVQIQDALNNAGSRGIFLLPGTYNLASAVEPLAGQLVRGAGETTILKPAANNMNAITVDGQEGVIIQDLCIDGTNAYTSATAYTGIGIHFTNTSTNGRVTSTTVKNCRIGICFDHGSSVGMIDHNRVLDCRDNHIVVRKSILSEVETAEDTFDFIVTNNYCDGLDVYDSITIYFTTGYAIISDNHIKNVNGSESASAIQLEGGTGGLSPLVTVTGNILRNCERGLTVSSLSYATITGNAIYDSSEYGMKLQNSFYSTISANVVVNSARSGIWIVTNSRRLNVTGNYLMGNGSGSNDAGIWVNATSNHNIQGNFVLNNNNAGIYMDYCSSISVRDNFVNNNGGSQATGVYEFAAVSEGNHFSNNYSFGHSGPNWNIVDNKSSYINNVRLNPSMLYALGDITGTASIDRINGDVVTATLTGDTTLTITNGKVSGDHLSLVLFQGGSGSYSVAWPANVSWSGDTAPTLVTAIDDFSVVTLIWDGDSWLGSASGQSLSGLAIDAEVVHLTGDESVDGTKTFADGPIISQLKDVNGNPWLSASATASAVNCLQIANAAASGPILLSPTGTDTNIGVTLKSKGTGKTTLQAGTDSSTAIQFLKSGGSVILNADTSNSRVSIGFNATTPNSVLEVKGSIATAIATKTATYTLTATDSVILADATSAAFTVNLPTAVGITGRQYTIKKIDSSSNAVTIDGNGSQTIDGATTQALGAQWSAITVVSDGANWLVAGQNL